MLIILSLKHLRSGGQNVFFRKMCTKSLYLLPLLKGRVTSSIQRKGALFLGPETWVYFSLHYFRGILWIQHIIIAITSTTLFSITISVQVLPIKKIWIKLKNKIIGSLRYHDGGGDKSVTFNFRSRLLISMAITRTHLLCQMQAKSFSAKFLRIISWF